MMKHLVRWYLGALFRVAAHYKKRQWREMLKRGVVPLEFYNIGRKKNDGRDG